jgi:hypothetical protein
VALYHRDGNFEVVAARPDGLDRPWARRYAPDEAQPARGSAVRPEPDATPPSEAAAEE